MKAFSAEQFVHERFVSWDWISYDTFDKHASVLDDKPFSVLTFSVVIDTDVNEAVVIETFDKTTPPVRNDAVSRLTPFT